MIKSKIFDCITFFDNNFMFDLRYNILKNYVDCFVICESKFDHRGNKKKINFIKNKDHDASKVKHFVMEKPFPKNSFSDPDEIQNPETLSELRLTKKYGIFMQKCFNYKFNLFNKFESPWEGSRVCKKKNLKSFTELRKKSTAKAVLFL